MNPISTASRLLHYGFISLNIVAIGLLGVTTSNAANKTGGGQFTKPKKTQRTIKKAIPTIPEISVGGVWKDSEGHTNSFPDISSGSFNATYRTQKLRLAGKLLGKLGAGKFTGIWTQTWSRKKCAKPRHGTSYWGRISFSFNSSRTRFSGKWGHCDGPLHTNMTGRKQ